MRKTPIASTYVIGAGKALELSIDSDYFRCLEADGNFAVAFDHGPPLPWAAGMSYRVRPLAGQQPARIGHVRMENAGAADVTVTVVWGGGEVVDDRKTLTGTVQAEIQNWPAVQDVAVPGGVNVNNFPAAFQVSNFPAVQDVDVPGGVAVTNFPAGFNVNNFPAVQDVQRQPEPVGASFLTFTLSSGVQEVVAPASNTAGALLRTAVMRAPGSSGEAEISIKPTAPSGVADTAALVLLRTFNAGTASIPRPILIPAGYGLWVATTSSAAFASLSWDLL